MLHTTKYQTQPNINNPIQAMQHTTKYQQNNKTMQHTIKYQQNDKTRATHNQISTNRQNPCNKQIKPMQHNQISTKR